MDAGVTRICLPRICLPSSSDEVADPTLCVGGAQEAKDHLAVVVSASDRIEVAVQPVEKDFPEALPGKAARKASLSPPSRGPLSSVDVPLYLLIVNWGYRAIGRARRQPRVPFAC